MKSWLTHASTFLLGAVLVGTAVSLAWVDRHLTTPILDTAEKIERGQGIGAAQNYARLAQLAERRGTEPVA